MMHWCKHLSNLRVLPLRSRFPAINAITNPTIRKAITIKITTETISDDKGSSLEDEGVDVPRRLLPA